MTSRTSLVPCRSAGRVLVLLVLAVLTGVLGMHALAPGGIPVPRTDVPNSMAMPAVMSQTAAGHEVNGSCSHADGGGGHLDHADETCAAAGIGSPYTPPALSGDLTTEPGTDALLDGVPETSPGSRAPPDLAELQLLRI